MSLRYRLIGRHNNPSKPEVPFEEKVRKARVWQDHRYALICEFHEEQIEKNRDELTPDDKVVTDYDKAFALDAKVRSLLFPEQGTPNIILVDAFAALAKPLERSVDPRPEKPVSPNNSFMLEDLGGIEQEHFIQALFDNLQRKSTDGNSYRFMQGRLSSYGVKEFVDAQKRTGFHITDYGSGAQFEPTAEERTGYEHYVLLNTGYKPILRYADGENDREDTMRHQDMQAIEVLTLAADMFATESN